MTRNDIAKSLKPIEWAYRHEDNTYKASLGVGGNSLEINIFPSPGDTGLLFLRISRNGYLFAEEHKKCHKTLDSAMQEARNFLVNEVCNLFELDEQ